MMRRGIKRLCGIALIAVMAGIAAGCGAETKTETETDAGKAEENMTEKDTEEEQDSATEQEFEEPQASINTVGAQADRDVDVQMVADEILNGGDFKDKLEAVDVSIALTKLYNLDADQVDAAVFYENSNATAEEIVVIKVKSEDYVETVREAYEARISGQKDAYRDYLPDEIPKLENAVIYTNANCAVLCISNDSEKAQSLIENLFK